MTKKTTAKPATAKKPDADKLLEELMHGRTIGDELEDQLVAAEEEIDEAERDVDAAEDALHAAQEKHLAALRGKEFVADKIRRVHALLKGGGGELGRVIEEKSTDAALLALLNAWKKAPWEKYRKIGATDEHLQLAFEVGWPNEPGAKHTRAQGGPSGGTPKVWINVPDYHGKPTFEGKALYAEARRVLGIPQPKAKLPAPAAKKPAAATAPRKTITGGKGKLKGEDAAALGVAYAATQPAYIGQKLAETRGDKPITITPFAMEGRQWVSPGGAGVHGDDEVEALPLYTPADFKAKFGAKFKTVTRPRDPKTDAQREEFYTGVIVSVRGERFVIGPRAERRTLLFLAPRAAAAASPKSAPKKKPTKKGGGGLGGSALQKLADAEAEDRRREQEDDGAEDLDDDELDAAAGTAARMPYAKWYEQCRKQPGGPNARTRTSGETRRFFGRQHEMGSTAEAAVAAWRRKATARGPKSAPKKKPTKKGGGGLGGSALQKLADAEAELQRFIDKLPKVGAGPMRAFDPNVAAAAAKDAIAKGDPGPISKGLVAGQDAMQKLLDDPRLQPSTGIYGNPTRHVQGWKRGQLIVLTDVGNDGKWRAGFHLRWGTKLGEELVPVKVTSEPWDTQARAKLAGVDAAAAYVKRLRAQVVGPINAAFRAQIDDVAKRIAEWRKRVEGEAVQALVAAKPEATRAELADLGYRPQTFNQWLSTFKAVVGDDVAFEPADPRIRAMYDAEERPSDAARKFLEQDAAAEHHKGLKAEKPPAQDLAIPTPREAGQKQTFGQWFNSVRSSLNGRKRSDLDLTPELARADAEIVGYYRAGFTPSKAGGLLVARAASATAGPAAPRTYTPAVRKPNGVTSHIDPAAQAVGFLSHAGAAIPAAGGMVH